METFTDVLNKNLNVHSGPTKEQIQSAVDSLDRLISELDRPQNRELIRFAIAWQQMEKELTILEAKIKERIAQKAANPMDEFLKQLIKKD